MSSRAVELYRILRSRATAVKCASLLQKAREAAEAAETGSSRLNLLLLTTPVYALSGGLQAGIDYGRGYTDHPWAIPVAAGLTAGSGLLGSFIVGPLVRKALSPVTKAMIRDANRRWLVDSLIEGAGDLGTDALASYNIVWKQIMPEFYNREGKKKLKDMSFGDYLLGTY